MDFFNDKFIRVSKTLVHSKYWTHLLSSEEKYIYLMLVDSVAVSGIYYPKGLLISNIKIDTLLEKVGNGIGRTKLRSSLQKLHHMGAITIIRRPVKLNNYFLGFRLKNNDWALLLYHLINKYEETLSNHMSVSEATNIDVGPYTISLDAKNYILDNFEDTNFLTKKNGLRMTITESLFGRNDCHDHGWSRLAAVQ